MQGPGVASCTAKPIPITIQEAMVEAMRQPSRLGIWVTSKFCSFVIIKDLSRLSTEGALPTGRKDF